MKLNFNALKNTLKNKSFKHNLFIIFGDEPWQKETALNSLTDYFKSHEFFDTERQHFEKSIDPNWFFQATDNLSLFSEKKLVICRLGNIPDEKSKKLLLDIHQHLSEDTGFILILPHITTKQQKQSGFINLEKNGVLIPIWQLNAYQLGQLIQQLSFEKKIKLNDNAKQALIERTEGNILACAQTLEKLSILSDDQNTFITEEQIKEIIETQSHYDTFSLNEAFLKQNKRKSLLILNQLKQSNGEIVLILWGLTQEIRILIELSHTQPYEYDQIFQKNRIWKTKQNFYLNALRIYQINQLKEKLNLCQKIDQLIKTYQIENAWQLLIQLLLF